MQRRVPMHLLARLLLPVLLLGGGRDTTAAAPEPPRTSPAASIADLASHDETARFDAILALVESGDPRIDGLLAQAREAAPFRDPGSARAALEFVRLKRAGRGVGGTPSELQEGMNIILISLDTLRADHLGCYGYHRKTSPNIDAVARRGALFDKAYSPSSWTLPVHMSILTSLYPSFHGVERSGARWNVRLTASEKPMAQYLKEAGFVTAALVAHPFLDAKWGFARGFDLYQRYETDAKAQSDRASLWLQWHVRRVRQGLVDSRFFLFLHYMDAHLPYDAPAEFQKRFPVETTREDAGPGAGRSCVSGRRPTSWAEHDRSRALYDSDINYLDTHLGRFFRSLETLGLADSTLVILTSDHGEEFGDHGLSKHKVTLYEEVLRVPLIMTYPRAIAPRQRIEEPVSLLDILPTVLDLVDQAVPARLQGISLLPHLRSKDEGAPPPLSRSRPLFAELGPLGLQWDFPFHRKAIRTNEYKLIASYSKDGQVTKELFDLVRDPRERCNAYEELQNAQAVRSLEEQLGQFIREGMASRESRGAEDGFEVDDELRERLRALGYID